MDRRKLVIAVAALLVLVAAGLGLSMTQNRDAPTAERKTELAAKEEEQVEDICASTATYARLKQVTFEEAVRIRNADPANLDTLATHSIVRMENPVVKSRDEDLNVTVCSGRLILELPPGAERAFGGERRLSANVEYAAQSTADGSGLVFQMEGAEPIIYKLAAFDLQGQRAQAPAADPEETELAEAAPRRDVEPDPEPSQPERDRQREAEDSEPARTPAPRTKARPAPVPVVVARSEPPELRQPIRTRNGSNPSFSCRSGRSRSERMVCSSNQLAAKDRAMSTQFYTALNAADPATKRELRRTRDRFLAYRERCGTEACIADAYEGRIAEIRDIMAESR